MNNHASLGVKLNHYDSLRKAFIVLYLFLVMKYLSYFEATLLLEDPLIDYCLLKMVGSRIAYLQPDSYNGWW